MTSAPKRRLQALSEQLVVPPADPGTFEDILKIRHIAPTSAGPFVPLSTLSPFPVLPPFAQCIKPIKVSIAHLTNQQKIPVSRRHNHRSQFSSRYWPSYGPPVRAEWRTRGLYLRFHRPIPCSSRARVEKPLS